MGRHKKNESLHVYVKAAQLEESILSIRSKIDKKEAELRQALKDLKVERDLMVEEAYKKAGPAASELVKAKLKIDRSAAEAPEPEVQEPEPVKVPEVPPANGRKRAANG